ncbi:mannosyltransferase [Purpureocillium lavendulum]|uniref:Mannosyltransferase n=1 Tax=Purpureocillium lavendulum TaxID=1247861 RepID=A0AB34FZK4_9HYPO|nr:mannosyltransferase [Purpureocillium lavendulum]
MAATAAAPSTARNARKPPNFLRDIIVIRLINAWWITTFFQPDEFFQSLEPAWRLAFGPESGAWLTWHVLLRRYTRVVEIPRLTLLPVQEWHHQLRSSLHPALFAAAYIVADKLSSFIPAGNVFRTFIVMGAPKTLQAVIAGLGDWYAWQLAVKIYGSGSIASFFALFLQIFSPWQWYVSTRTFSNSLETTLTVMALYYWPWELLGSAKPTKENPRGPALLRNIWSLRASLALAALAVVLRPTNVLIWATVVGVALTRVTLRGTSPLSWTTVFVLFREAALCGPLVVGASFVSDRLYFGFWTFPPYNWLNFNISQSLAVFYGRNPWHYYLLQGIPLLCTTSLPFALAGLYSPSASSPDQANTLRTLSYTVFVTVGALSLISHKEVRFIYPLLPVLNVLAAPFAASFFTSDPKPAAASKSKSGATRRPALRNKPYLIAALGVNLVLAGFLTFLHQPAPLTVMSYLRKEYERIHPDSVRLAHATRRPPEPNHDPLFALFLMPCHSTPWRSHLVYPGLTAYALTCEPPLHTLPNTPERDGYRDEADRFYDDPVGFLTGELFAASNTSAASPAGPAATSTLPLPRYIVGFEGIEPWLREFLDTPRGRQLGMHLTRTWGAFNGFANEDWRRSGRMLVWDTGIYDDDDDRAQAKKPEV